MTINISTPFFTSGIIVAEAAVVAESGTTLAKAMVPSSATPIIQFSNGTSGFQLRQLPDLDPFRTAIVSFILITIVLCTVFGNILVLLAVVTTPKLRTATNYFIVNLAIADMMLGLTVLPFSTSIEILDEVWIFGQVS